MCPGKDGLVMFDLGKKFRVTMIVGAGTKEYLHCEVVEIDMPAVNFRQYAKEIIVNVASPHFVKAILQEEQVADQSCHAA